VENIEGYAGFAIGRTIWWEAIEGFGAGLLGRADAVRQISDNYLRAVDAYLSAER